MSNRKKVSGISIIKYLKHVLSGGSEKLDSAKNCKILTRSQEYADCAVLLADLLRFLRSYERPISILKTFLNVS